MEARRRRASLEEQAVGVGAALGVSTRDAVPPERALAAVSNTVLRGSSQASCSDRAAPQPCEAAPRRRQLACREASRLPRTRAVGYGGTGCSPMERAKRCANRECGPSRGARGAQEAPPSRRLMRRHSLVLRGRQDILSPSLTPEASAPTAVTTPERGQAGSAPTGDDEAAARPGLRASQRARPRASRPAARASRRSGAAPARAPPRFQDTGRVLRPLARAGFRPGCYDVGTSRPRSRRGASTPRSRPPPAGRSAQSTASSEPSANARCAKPRRCSLPARLPPSTDCHSASARKPPARCAR